MTLTETITVLAILATLLALIVPAVQSSREAARAMTCRNRLKQIGIASLGFHDTHREFPDGGRMFQLLPYVEQQALYDALKPCAPFSLLLPDFDEAKEYPPIPNDLSPNVTTFVCPSSSAEAGKFEVSYLANKGSFWKGTLFDNKNIRSPVANGMAATHWYGGAVQMSNVYDGASNTAFVSETRQPLALGVQPTSFSNDSRQRFFWLIDGIPRNTLEFGQLCVDPKRPAYNPYDNTFIARHDRLAESHYEHIGPPNSQACIVATPGSVRPIRTVPPSSHHTGGVNLVMVDGSVRFISDQIDLGEWQQLGSRDSRLKESPAEY